MCTFLKELSCEMRGRREREGGRRLHQRVRPQLCLSLGALLEGEKKERREENENQGRGRWIFRDGMVR